jgi:hypothetical protein
MHGFQAEGLIHTSPGSALGFRAPLSRCRPIPTGRDFIGFIGSYHLKGRSPGLNHLGNMNRAFSAQKGLWPDKPRALPWAGMKDAVGVSDEATVLAGRCIPRARRRGTDMTTEKMWVMTSLALGYYLAAPPGRKNAALRAGRVELVVVSSIPSAVRAWKGRVTNRS